MQWNQISANANEDLGAHARGKFSPEDWDRILLRAEESWKTQLSTHSPAEAWREVVRDFHKNNQWGFVADYRPPEDPSAHLGVSLLVVAFLAFTVSIAAVVWLGQIFTAGDEPYQGWALFLTIGAVACGFLGFLWHFRNYKDS